MRQTGILAGAAAYALSHNFELLPRVHDLAKKLENGLQHIGVEITSPAETCMVRSFTYFLARSDCLVAFLQPVLNRSRVLPNNGEGSAHV